jgi:hypothetical protein
MARTRKKTTTQHSEDSNTAFVRIHPTVRNRLRRYCKRNGSAMGWVVTTVLGEFLNREEKKASRANGKAEEARRIARG